MNLMKMGFEISADYDDLYIMMLKECINKNKTIFELIDELDKINEK